MVAIVSIESMKNAEKAGHGKAYLARLTPGYRSGVEREFAPKIKDLHKGNRRAYTMLAHAGDIFEARRWWWDADSGRYVGGTVWFGIQGDGSIFPLDRDEAIASLYAERIDTSVTADAPAIQRPGKFAINRVFSRPISREDENIDAPNLISHG